MQIINLQYKSSLKSRLNSILKYFDSIIHLKSILLSFCRATGSMIEINQNDGVLPPRLESEINLLVYFWRIKSRNFTIVKSNKSSWITYFNFKNTWRFNSHIIVYLQFTLIETKVNKLIMKSMVTRKIN